MAHRKRCVLPFLVNFMNITINLISCNRKVYQNVNNFGIYRITWYVSIHLKKKLSILNIIIQIIIYYTNPVKIYVNYQNFIFHDTIFINNKYSYNINAPHIVLFTILFSLLRLLHTQINMIIRKTRIESIRCPCVLLSINKW